MHRLATVHARDNQRRHDTAYLNKRLFYYSKVRRLKIISRPKLRCCELVKLRDVIRSGPVLLECRMMI